MSREEVLKFYGELKADGIELMHDYGMMLAGISEGSHQRRRRPYYLLRVFLRPGGSQRRPSCRVDETRKLLDRTAAMGTTRAMIVPGFSARLFPFGSAGMDDRGLRACAEHAQSIGVTLLAENIDYPRCGRSWVEARSAGYLPGG